MSELAIKDGQAFWNDAQQAALKQLGLGEAPRADVEVFFHQAQRTGLDPFARQIYMIGRRQKQGNDWVTKWTIQTAIDGFRIIRDRKGTYRGHVEEWCGEDGEWRDVWLAKTPPVAARVQLHIEGYTAPVSGVALWSEFAPMKDNKPTGMWGKMPALMLAKCAEALALRKAYPNDLSGIFTTDELEQAHAGEGSQEVEAVVEAAAPAGVEAAAPVWEREQVDAFLRRVAAETQLEPLFAMYGEAKEDGALGLVVDAQGTTVEALLWERRRAIEAGEVEPEQADEPEQVVEPESVPMVLDVDGGAP